MFASLESPRRCGERSVSRKRTALSSPGRRRRVSRDVPARGGGGREGRHQLRDDKRGAVAALRAGRQRSSARTAGQQDSRGRRERRDSDEARRGRTTSRIERGTSTNSTTLTYLIGGKRSEREYGEGERGREKEREKREVSGKVRLERHNKRPKRPCTTEGPNVCNTSPRGRFQVVRPERARIAQCSRGEELARGVNRG